MEEFQELLNKILDSNLAAEVSLTKDPNKILNSYLIPSIHIVEEDDLTYCNAGEFFPVLCQKLDYVTNFNESKYDYESSQDALEFLNLIFQKLGNVRLVKYILKPHVPYGDDYYIIIGNCLRFSYSPAPEIFDLGPWLAESKGSLSEYYIIIAQPGSGSNIDPEGLADLV